MMEANYAVEINGLTKKYGSNKALNNISFYVKRGEIMGFLGPNGAGKSTTMNILTGCISASEGSVRVCGCDVLENPKIVKSKIGYLPENPPLYFDMTVWEYLMFVCELKKVKKNKAEHIEKIMALVQIDEMKNRMIKNLSKGYKQRVGLAQALIGDPEVLILDEPTVGLDPRQIVEIRNVIKEIGKERTIILSTHILQEVSAVCDRVTIIAKGKIVAENTIEGLEEMAGAKDKFILKVRTNSNAKDIIESVENVICVEEDYSSEQDVMQFIVTQAEGTDVRSELCAALVKAGCEVLELRPAGMSLEEIFIKLTSTVVEEELPEETADISEDDSDITSDEEPKQDFSEIPEEELTQEVTEDDSNI